MKQRFSSVLDSIPPSGIRRFFDLVLDAKDIISLGVGEPDFTTPWKIRGAAIKSLEKGQTSYTSNKGLDQTRTSIANYLNTRFKASYDPKEEIILTNGVSEGVDIALRSIINPGDEIILPVPSYVCYSPLIRLCGGKVITIDTSETNFIPDPKRIAQAITPQTKAVILCSPNNPTGTSIPKQQLLEILELAKTHDLWVLSDEIYAELSYTGPYQSFAALPDAKSRTILLSGFSKAFAMTGWRLGYLAGPQDLIQRALKIHQYSALCAPIIAQTAAITALDHCLKDVEDMQKSYHARRNLFIAKIKEMGLESAPADGAFYGYVNIKKTGLTSEEFALGLLHEEKVAVVPGTAFGECGEGYIRCCYATNITDLSEALRRIAQFTKKRLK